MLGVITPVNPGYLSKIDISIVVIVNGILPERHHFYTTRIREEIIW